LESGNRYSDSLFFLFLEDLFFRTPNFVLSVPKIGIFTSLEGAEVAGPFSPRALFLKMMYLQAPFSPAFLPFQHLGHACF